MFLTRLGLNAKMIVTGDITQIDLPYSQPSGLIHAMKVLDGIKVYPLWNSTKRYRSPPTGTRYSGSI